MPLRRPLLKSAFFRFRITGLYCWLFRSPDRDSVIMRLTWAPPAPIVAGAIMRLARSALVLTMAVNKAKSGGCAFERVKWRRIGGVRAGQILWDAHLVPSVTRDAARRRWEMGSDRVSQEARDSVLTRTRAAPWKNLSARTVTHSHTHTGTHTHTRLSHLGLHTRPGPTSHGAQWARLMGWERARSPTRCATSSRPPWERSVAKIMNAGIDYEYRE